VSEVSTSRYAGDGDFVQTEALSQTVDDDRDIVETIKGNLELDGYEVLCAFDGQSAIEVAEKHRPGVMILDLNLPDISGRFRSSRATSGRRSSKAAMPSAPVPAAETSRPDLWRREVTTLLIWGSSSTNTTVPFTGRSLHLSDVNYLDDVQDFNTSSGSPRNQGWRRGSWIGPSDFWTLAP
jgi:hypothetical protein